MKNNETNSTYTTGDLYLAAVLRINGFKLIKCKKDERGKGIFIFEDKDDRSALIQKYFAGELNGNLKSYVSAWKDLKGILYSIGD
jgi:hypothetical protein